MFFSKTAATFLFASSINSSTSLLASNDSFKTVLTGSLSLFKINFTSFLLKEIDPSSFLFSLKLFAVLFNISIESVILFSNLSSFLDKEISLGIVFVLFNIIN